MTTFRNCEFLKPFFVGNTSNIVIVPLFSRRVSGGTSCAFIKLANKTKNVMNTPTNVRLSEKEGAAVHFTDSYTAAVTCARNANPNAFKIKNVLAVVRPSPSSAGVLKSAGWLAFQLGCEMTVLQVAPNGCKAGEPADMQAEFKRTTGLDTTPIRAILIRPAATGLSPILRAAKGEHADLAVISADFYKVPLHFWQTNMLGKLIRHLHCPLLIIGEKSRVPDSNWKEPECARKT